MPYQSASPCPLISSVVGCVAGGAIARRLIVIVGACRSGEKCFDASQQLRLSGIASLFLRRFCAQKGLVHFLFLAVDLLPT
jgi:hypothetical protein